MIVAGFDRVLVRARVLDLSPCGRFAKRYSTGIVACGVLSSVVLTMLLC